MNSVFPHPAIKAMRFLGRFMLSSITVLPWILIFFDYQNHGDEVFPAQNDGEPTLATLATNQPTNQHWHHVKQRFPHPTILQSSGETQLLVMCRKLALKKLVRWPEPPPEPQHWGGGRICHVRNWTSNPSNLTSSRFEENAGNFSWKLHWYWKLLPLCCYQRCALKKRHQRRQYTRSCFLQQKIQGKFAECPTSSLTFSPKLSYPIHSMIYLF